MVKPDRAAIILFTLFILMLPFFCAGCIQSAPATSSGSGNGDAWRTIPLRDIHSSEDINITAFAGKPVVVYTFTVTCPICTRQQQEITALAKEMGEDVVVIGLDIDPNEDPAILQSHITQNGFGGYYIISPPEMTRSLVDRFGPRIITPASAPVVMVCPGENAFLLNTGIKSAGTIRDIISLEC